MTDLIDKKSTEQAGKTTPTGHVSIMVRGANAAGRARRDVFTKYLLGAVMIIAAIPLVLIVAEVVREGAGAISLEFFTEREPPPAREGGGYAAGFVGTGIMMLMAIGMAVPIGLAAAVYLVDYGKGFFATIIRFFTDVMTGIPSVFVGLAVYAILILGSGQVIGFGGFTGAVAIAIVMLPIIVRSSEEVLKTVSQELRRGAFALGARKWQTTTKVVLPAAAPGLTTSVMLGIARGTGETAPLILTAFGNVNIVWAFFNVAIGAVPLQIYSGAGQPFDPGIERAWGGALSLLVIVMVLTVIARYIGARATKAHRI
ncbi:phosphate ABC transporter membrane protein 2 (PhoT family) [Rhodoglobus vestalii]|uniref:Phosphate transport system permease protein PstA n=1 Tax=Rhodoglobus vestalii TaxID=193384 RepID=A0A8H2PV98_9MICO|nr:phosphate ABC transporter permease PstA [Rhodoglobus vestalii]TQO20632.1 phosphate ABC transporter membrane protein 2 (PhoT family) [Rhodoglobus vestalii]